MATPVVNELSELYKAADVGAIASLMSRLGKFAGFSLDSCLDQGFMAKMGIHGNTQTSLLVIRSSVASSDGRVGGFVLLTPS